MVERNISSLETDLHFQKGRTIHGAEMRGTLSIKSTIFFVFSIIISLDKFSLKETTDH